MTATRVLAATDTVPATTMAFSVPPLAVSVVPETMVALARVPPCSVKVPPPIFWTFPLSVNVPPERAKVPAMVNPAMVLLPESKVTLPPEGM